ncbi:MAG: hypothetical protein ACON5N_01625 [Akkermansiaceae bacterium]
MKLRTSLLTFSTLASAPLGAAVVYADFNDNSIGSLGSFTTGAGQGGGSGFLAGDVWANTGTISVIPGDLTAPGSTGYALTQSGPAQSVQSSFNAARQTTRATATTMGTASDVWFSFILNQPDAASRGGITFNQNGSSPGNPRIVAVGGDVRIALSTLQPSGGGATMSLGIDTLFLGQLQIDPAGDETLSIWINPDVSGGIAGLGPADTSLTEQAASVDGGIARVGIQSYGTAATPVGGVVDAFIVSDAADPNQAFFDVTGVSAIPEPSSALLSLLASLGLLRRRR